jgi:Ubiquitin family
MYVRVKRKQVTVFISTDPTERISTVKAKLASMLKDVPAAKLKLFANAANPVALEDDKTVDSYKIENDAVLLLSYQNEGVCPLFLGVCLSAVRRWCCGVDVVSLSRVCVCVRVCVCAC